VKRGEVWLATLDPTIDSEITKTRPCLIVSPDEMNQVLRRVIVAPLTSGSHPAPFRIASTLRGKPGLILLDQIRTVDRQRIVKRVGAVPDTTLEETLATLSSLFVK
jgi:mRNA interferase MazF